MTFPVLIVYNVYIININMDHIMAVFALKVSELEKLGWLGIYYTCTCTVCWGYSHFTLARQT
jgi:hypothetical protein